MIKKIVLLSFLVFSFFLIISSVAAADYYVDSDTEHSDIANWMRKDAKNGDNLVFTGCEYDLTDTIVVSKSVNIKGVNKTQINLKKSKNMFKITVSGVNFDGLSLNYYLNDYADHVIEEYAIYASGSSKKININNTEWESYGLFLHFSKGTIANSIISSTSGYALGVPVKLK